MQKLKTWHKIIYFQQITLKHILKHSFSNFLKIILEDDELARILVVNLQFIKHNLALFKSCNNA